MRAKTTLDLILFAESASPETEKNIDFNPSVLGYLNLPSPEGALTGAYGISGRRSISELAGAGLGAGVDLLPIAAAIPCKTFWGIKLLSLSGAESDKFAPVSSVDVLNLMRCDKLLKHEIQMCWNEISSIHGKNKKERDFESHFVANGTSRPDWIPLLLKNIRFKHIKAVVYPVSSGDRVFSVGSYFGNYKPSVVEYKSAAGYPHSYNPVV